MTDEEKKARKREYHRAWRAANRERQRESDRVRHANAKANACPEEKARKRERDREQARTRRSADPDKARAERRAWYAANLEKAREQKRVQHLKDKYGLTPASRNTLLESQGFCCARCGTDRMDSKKGWATDHCHTTGVVRGILCQGCNTLLGRQGDNEEGVMTSAALSIIYLRRAAGRTLPENAGICAGLLF